MSFDTDTIVVYETDHQGPLWEGLHRRLVLVMLAYNFLVKQWGSPGKSHCLAGSALVELEKED